MNVWISFPHGGPRVAKKALIVEGGCLAVWYTANLDQEPNLIYSPSAWTTIGQKDPS